MKKRINELRKRYSEFFQTTSDFGVVSNVVYHFIGAVIVTAGIAAAITAAIMAVYDNVIEKMIFGESDDELVDQCEDE